MGKETSKNIRVGLLVSIGTVFLITAMYFIGSKQNLFGSTFHISANFKNVNGLMIGNSVRYGGINVGTIDDIDIINDSTIKVSMIIENDIKWFIRKNTLASVGTDGLMGNKLVNLNSMPEKSPPIQESDTIKSLPPIETDAMLRTLNQTNEEGSAIAKNIKLITQKINSPNTLWNLLMDTAVAQNVKTAIVNIKQTTNQTTVITSDLSTIIQHVKAGQGTVGKLLTDSSFAVKLNQAMDNIKTVSDSLAYISADLRTITTKIKNGKGAFETIITDTAFANNLSQSMINIKMGSKLLNEDLEALQHSALLRKYFKEQEKQAQTKN